MEFSHSMTVSEALDYFVGRLTMELDNIRMKIGASTMGSRDDLILLLTTVNADLDALKYNANYEIEDLKNQVAASGVQGVLMSEEQRAINDAEAEIYKQLMMHLYGTNVRILKHIQKKYSTRRPTRK